MPFLTQGKTNWKFIAIVIVLAILVGGGILGYMKVFKREMISLSEFPEIKKLEKIIEPEKAIEDETADWKSYRNEEYGFEIKYPKEWSVSETPKEVLTYPNSLSENMFCHYREECIKKGARLSECYVCPILLSVYQNLANLSLKEFFEKRYAAFYGNFKLQKEESFFIEDGIPAKKFIFTSVNDNSKVTVAIKKEEKIIEIRDHFGLSVDSIDPKFVKIFNQILSTFRFLPPK